MMSPEASLTKNSRSPKASKASYKPSPRVRLFGQSKYGFEGFTPEECQKSSSHVLTAKHRIQTKEQHEKQLEREIFMYNWPACSTCSLIFTSNSHLTLHQKYCGQISLSRPLQFQSFLGNEDLIREPLSEMVICPWCPILCSSVHALQKHVSKCKEAHRKRENRTVVDMLPCPECAFKHSRLKPLLIHLQYHYIGDVQCSPCGVSFRSLDDLSVHLTTCKRKYYNCSDCSKPFFDASALQTHLSSCKSAQCLKCAERFISRASCMEHILMHLTKEWSNLRLKMTDGILYAVSRDEILRGRHSPSSPESAEKYLSRSLLSNEETPQQNSTPIITSDSDSPPFSISRSVLNCGKPPSSPSASATEQRYSLSDDDMSFINDQEDSSSSFDGSLCDDDSFSVPNNEVYEIENDAGETELVGETEMLQTEHHQPATERDSCEEQESHIDTTHLFTPAVEGSSELTLTVVNVEGGANLFNWDDDFDNNDNTMPVEEHSANDAHNAICDSSEIPKSPCELFANADRNSKVDRNDDQDSGIDAMEDRDSNNDKMEGPPNYSSLGDSVEAPLDTHNLLPVYSSDTLDETSVPSQVLDSDLIVNNEVVVSNEAVVPNEGVVCNEDNILYGEGALSSGDCPEIDLRDRKKSKQTTYSVLEEHTYSLLAASPAAFKLKIKAGSMASSVKTQKKCSKKTEKSSKRIKKPTNQRSKMPASVTFTDKESICDTVQVNETSAKENVKSTISKETEHRENNDNHSMPKDILNCGEQRSTELSAVVTNEKTEEVVNNISAAVTSAPPSHSANYQEPVEVTAATATVTNNQLKEILRQISLKRSHLESDTSELPETATTSVSNNQLKEILPPISLKPNDLEPVTSQLPQVAPDSAENHTIEPLRQIPLNRKLSALPQLPSKNLCFISKDKVKLHKFECGKVILPQGMVPLFQNGTIYGYMASLPTVMSQSNVSVVKEINTTQASDSVQADTESTPSSDDSIPLPKLQPFIKLDGGYSIVNGKVVRPLLPTGNIIMNQGAQGNETVRSLNSSNGAMNSNPLPGVNKNQANHWSKLRKREQSMLARGFKQIATSLPHTEDINKTNLQHITPGETVKIPVLQNICKSSNPSAEVKGKAHDSQPPSNLVASNNICLRDQVKGVFAPKVQNKTTSNDLQSFSSMVPDKANQSKAGTREMILQCVNMLTESTQNIPTVIPQPPIDNCEEQPPANDLKDEKPKSGMEEMLADLLNLIKEPRSSTSVNNTSNSVLQQKDEEYLKTGMKSIITKYANILKEDLQAEAKSAVNQESSNNSLMFVFSSEGNLLPHPNFPSPPVNSVQCSKENLPPLRQNSSLGDKESSTALKVGEREGNKSTQDPIVMQPTRNVEQKSTAESEGRFDKSTIEVRKKTPVKNTKYHVLGALESIGDKESNTALVGERERNQSTQAPIEMQPTRNVEQKSTAESEGRFDKSTIEVKKKTPVKNAKYDVLGALESIGVKESNTALVGERERNQSTQAPIEMQPTRNVEQKSTAESEGRFDKSTIEVKKKTPVKNAKYDVLGALESIGDKESNTTLVGERERNKSTQAPIEMQPTRNVEQKSTAESEGLFDKSTIEVKKKTPVKNAKYDVLGALESNVPLSDKHNKVLKPSSSAEDSDDDNPDSITPDHSDEDCAVDDTIANVTIKSQRENEKDKSLPIETIENIGRTVKVNLVVNQKVEMGVVKVSPVKKVALRNVIANIAREVPSKEKPIGSSVTTPKTLNKSHPPRVLLENRDAGIEKVLENEPIEGSVIGVNPVKEVTLESVIAKESPSKEKPRVNSCTAGNLLISPKSGCVSQEGTGNVPENESKKKVILVKKELLNSTIGNSTKEFPVTGKPIESNEVTSKLPCPSDSVDVLLQGRENIDVDAFISNISPVDSSSSELLHKRAVRKKTSSFHHRINSYPSRKLMSEMKHFNCKRKGHEGLYRKKEKSTASCKHCCQLFYHRNRLEQHLCLNLYLRRKFSSIRPKFIFIEEDVTDTLPVEANRTVEKKPSVPIEANRTVEKKPNVPIEANRTVEKKPNVPIEANRTVEKKPNVPIEANRTVEKKPNAENVSAIMSPFETYVRMRTEKRRFNCDLCKLTFKKFTKLHQHKADVHSESSTLVCHVCGKEFSRLQKLAVHCARSHNISINSTKKQEKASTESQAEKKCLNTEIKSRNEVDLPVAPDSLVDQSSCPPLVDGRDLGNKILDVRSDEKETSSPNNGSENIQCKYCNKIFNRKGGLQSHINQAHKVLHRCPACPRKFTYFDKMKSHCMKLHPTFEFSEAAVLEIQKPIQAAGTISSPEAGIKKESEIKKETVNNDVLNHKDSSERHSKKHKKRKWRIVWDSSSEEISSKTPRLSDQEVSPRPLVISFSKIKKPHNATNKSPIKKDSQDLEGSISRLFMCPLCHMDQNDSINLELHLKECGLKDRTEQSMKEIHQPSALSNETPPSCGEDENKLRNTEQSERQQEDEYYIHRNPTVEESGGEQQFNSMKDLFVNAANEMHPKISSENNSLNVKQLEECGTSPEQPSMLGSDQTMLNSSHCNLKNRRSSRFQAVSNSVTSQEQSPSPVVRRTWNHRGGWKCKVCQREFRAKGFLERHYIDSHGATSQYNCPYCHKTFVDFRSLRCHHKLRHKKKKWIFSEKNADSSIQNDLIGSTALVSNAGQSLNLSNLPSDQEIMKKCELCDQKFRKNVDLRRHNNKYHRYVKCDLCNLQFESQQLLSTHNSEVHLTNQMKMVENGDMEAETIKSHVDFTFDNKTINKPEDNSSSSLLKNEVNPVQQTESALSETSTVTFQSKTSSSLEQSKEEFRCSDCPLTYRKFSCLKRHRILMHGEPASHYCKICGKGFSYPHSLKNHVMTHSRGKAKEQRSGRHARKTRTGVTVSESTNEKPHGNNFSHISVDVKANTSLEEVVNCEALSKSCVEQEINGHESSVHKSVEENCHVPPSQTANVFQDDVGKWPLPNNGTEINLTASQLPMNPNPAENSTISSYSDKENVVSSFTNSYSYTMNNVSMAQLNPVPDYSSWNISSFGSSPSMGFVTPSFTRNESHWAPPPQDLSALNACSLCGLCLPSWYALQEHTFTAHPNPNYYAPVVNTPAQEYTGYSTYDWYATQPSHVAASVVPNHGSSSFQELSSHNVAHCSVCGLCFPSLLALQEHYGTHMAASKTTTLHYSGYL